MKIGIIGVTGRIGTILSGMILENELSGGTSSKTTDKQLENIVKNSDVLIDFSVPESSLKAIEIASKFKVPFVTGTTGFSDYELNYIKEYSKLIPILKADNFSVGIQLMAILIKKCSDVLLDFDFSIIDKHHNKKKDSPSGTALFLANQIDKKSQIVSVRAGNIFGDHICDVIGENEMISISHRVFNRDVFASGAINCAKWIVGKNPNLYTIRDYLENRIKCLE